MQMHRTFRIIATLFFVFACTISGWAQERSRQDGPGQERPNIVIILSDDHAYQAISAYGGDLMQTPNIDRIAREGVLFEKAYVTNSLCGPSRAVLLTGKYSHKNGYKDNTDSHFDAAQPSFAKRLQGAGYQTAWIGKYHLGKELQGFDYWKILPGQGHYFNPDFLLMDGSRERTEGYVTDLVEDAAENWLDERDRKKPFCLVIGHKATHRTWMPDTADLGAFDEMTFPLPGNFYDDYQGRPAAAGQDMTVSGTMLMDYDLKMYPEDTKDGNVTRMTPAQRARYKAYYDPIQKELEASGLTGKALTEWKYQRYMRDYLSTARSLDRNIGRTLDYLQANGLWENTIVIYMSDQGFFMGEHGWFDKRFMYEESFRTPFVMHYPGLAQPGTVNTDMVMNLDIAPTLLDAAGVDVPGPMQGRSLLPLLQGEEQGRQAMYYHYYENGAHSVSPHFGIRTQRYKLIRFYERVNSWELFDLSTDPGEMHNLYGKEGYQALTDSLKEELAALIAVYEDEEALKVFNTPVKPNIIYIYADDLGYGELGCYGQEKIKTPNLDRMAREGMRFTQHYTSIPVCAPARTMLLTGKHAGHAYIRGNYELGGFADSLEGGQMPLPPGTFTLPEMLQEAGYTTGMTGKWGLGMHNNTGAPLKQGFDYFYGYLDQKQAHNYYPTHLWENGRWDTLNNPLIDVHRKLDPAGATEEDFAYYTGNEYSGDKLTEKALEFIEQHQEGPFFLYMPYTIPHASLQVPEKYIKPYLGKFDEQPYYGEEGYAATPYPYSTYAGMISFLDAQVGIILERLKALGLDENTIVMFSSDNGTTFNGGVDAEFFNSTGGLRGLKMDLFEGGIRMPFIARWPGHIRPGSVSDHISAQYDMMATLAHLTGQRLEDTDGISLLPTLLGRPADQDEHDYLYFEYHARGGQLAIRKGDWKGVKQKQLLHADDNPWMIFNLRTDPGETTDVAAKHPELVREFNAIVKKEHQPSHIREWEFVDPKFDPGK